MRELNWDEEMSVVMTIDEKMEDGKTLPVVLIKNLSEKYPDIPKDFFQGLVSDYINHKKLYEWCESVGHKWVDTSYGNPEHGEMSGYCTRCEFSFRTSLY